MRPLPPFPPRSTWEELLRLALAEDVGSGDVTTPLVVSEEQRGQAHIEARQSLIACGLPIAAAVFHALDPTVHFEARAREGEPLSPGSIIASLEGSLRGLLAAERSALNFLARLCGVATWTRRFAEAIEGTGAVLVDTRKTLPGWRALDKYATAVGGARNHRFGLYDGILLKDNHVAAAGGVAAALKLARAAAPSHLRIQVEVESLEEAQQAVQAGADFLLLDNFSTDALRRTAALLKDQALLEASGGIVLTNAREVALSGVQRLSVGALTHSAPSADLSLELRPVEVAR